MDKLTKEQVQTASKAVRELRVSLSNYFLYNSENPMVLESLGRFSKTLESLFENLPSVALGESEGRLVVEGTPLDERLTGSVNMIKDIFLTHKIHSLTFSRGIEPQELKALFDLLRPRALPSGTTLTQVLAQKPLEHIQMNEKVYVAIKEGEKVVSAEDMGLSDQDNLQEALEALQYFLQIFSRVRPDSNKREVAMRLTEHMGDWLKEGNFPGMAGSGGPGGASEDGAGGGGTGGSNPFAEIVTGFLALKNSLSSLGQSDASKDIQISMDELLKRLVMLGEGQGMTPGSGGTAGAGSGEEQEALFNVDQVQNAIDSGKVEIFWDKALENKSAEKLPLLQGPEMTDLFESLWEGLWRQILTGDEKSQTVSLRQMNRLQWNSIPRPLQLDGFRNFRRFLSETRRPSQYSLGLNMLQNWLSMELEQPNWEELIETIVVLKQMAEMSPPLFEKQDLVARVTLETVFNHPALEKIFTGYSRTGPEGNNWLRLFSILAPWVGPFLWEKIEKAPADSAEWNKSVEMLEALENIGTDIVESLLGEKAGQEKMAKWTVVFKKILPPESFCAHCEKNWHSFTPDLQEKLMEMMEVFPRKAFRSLLIGLLEFPDQSMASRALALLPDVGRQGDARDIISAMRKYKPHSMGWDQFMIKACYILGKMADPYAINFLFELAEHYKFLEGHKDRPLEIRRAAIEALGNYHFQSVKNFLNTLTKGLEKELKPALEQALKSVEENFQKWREAQKAEGGTPSA
jgi:hypothetical protein